MARIRSVHPGLFTDEVFACLSADAQMFLIGLWTEADDQGIFEWKPLTLRMRLRPSKDGCVETLLNELVTAKCVKQYQAKGKSLGAIRNFRKYQRPKTPNSIHPITETISIYVGLSEALSEIEADKEDAFPPKGEITPQMEDGGKGKDEGVVIRAVYDPPAIERLFKRFKNGYPKRKGADPGKPAKEKFAAILKSGVPLEDILGGLWRYVDDTETKKNANTPYIPQMIKWLRDERWKDYPPPNPETVAAFASKWRIKSASDEYYAWQKAGKNVWDGCYVDSQWPPNHPNYKPLEAAE